MTDQRSRAESAIQLILAACAHKQYVSPYIVTVTDANGAKLAATIDEDGGTPFAGDFGSAGTITPPLSVTVTDARGESAAFSVGLFDDEDGQPLRPLITYPAGWIKTEPSGPDVPTSRTIQ